MSTDNRRALKELRQLPKLRDSLSYLYVEHCTIDKHEQAVALHDEEGRTHVPCASLALLLAGPGTTVSHAAVGALADNNCLVAWCGEQGVRMYGFGVGGSRSSSALLRQAALVSDPEKRLEVAGRLYHMRYQEEPAPGYSLEQLRGWEGRRVRDSYARAAREFGVDWQGRNYDRKNWSAGDAPNRALTAANACLYGICHAAILSLGLSPALGFIHTGTQLSFVYDLSDLYKTAVAIPAAFRSAAEGDDALERRTRIACRDAFKELNLLGRLADDIPRVLALRQDEVDAWFGQVDDPGLAAGLWSGDGAIAGGVNYGDPDS